ncbi:hypothetical protein ScPMuIL_016836 [Solemya velum]
MIPRLGNIKQIDFAQMELENVSDDINPFFTKAEMSKMSNYEKLRFKNMRKNFEMMVAVGLPVPKPSFMKNVRSRRKKVVEPESDDSDEDWTPATERRKSNRENKPVTYFNMPKDRQPRVQKRTAQRSSTATNDSKPKKKKVAVEAHTYPLRKLQETNYMDLEVPDDDHFLCSGIYCKNESCIDDTTGGTASRARFGPYSGEIIHDCDQAHDSGYCWQVYRNGKPYHFIDAHNPKKANWMRYVNCARTESEQNVTAYQHNGEIYYRSFKSIEAGTEILVWYGHDYGKELGIERGTDSKIFSQIKIKVINGESIYQCIWCKGAFSRMEYLLGHMRSQHGSVLANLAFKMRETLIFRREKKSNGIFKQRKQNNRAIEPGSMSEKSIPGEKKMVRNRARKFKNPTKPLLVLDENKKLLDQNKKLTDECHHNEQLIVTTFGENGLSGADNSVKHEVLTTATCQAAYVQTHTARRWWEDVELRTKPKGLRCQLSTVARRWWEDVELRTKPKGLRCQLSTVARRWWEDVELRTKPKGLRCQLSTVAQRWWGDGELRTKPKGLRCQLSTVARRWWEDGELRTKPKGLRCQLSTVARRWWEDVELRTKPKGLRCQLSTVARRWWEDGELRTKPKGLRCQLSTVRRPEYFSKHVACFIYNITRWN